MTTTTATYPWLVIRDDRTPGKFAVSSKHKTQAAANRRCRDLGRNCAEGRTKVIPAADLAAWLA